MNPCNAEFHWNVGPWSQVNILAQSKKWHPNLLCDLVLQKLWPWIPSTEGSLFGQDTRKSGQREMRPKESAQTEGILFCAKLSARGLCRIEGPTIGQKWRKRRKRRKNVGRELYCEYLYLQVSWLIVTKKMLNSFKSWNTNKNNNFASFNQINFQISWVESNLNANKRNYFLLGSGYRISNWSLLPFDEWDNPKNLFECSAGKQFGRILWQKVLI
jgi:hypothetical protein